ncbi:hypothetical protein KSS87_012435 [Heliosperma pusillum]|nr:hypothetical protein KSS87_012435 [Heliosperma pusillum]
MTRLQSSINVIVGAACRNLYVASWGRPWCRQPRGAMEGGRDEDGVHGEEARLQLQSGVRSDDGGGAVSVNVEKFREILSDFSAEGEVFDEADMVGTRRKRSESKPKAVALMPEEPEPLQIINAEAVNGPSDDELEKNDISDSGVEPAYDGGYDEGGQMMDEINEEEQMMDEINEEEEFEINDITLNGNEDVHTEDEEEEEDEEEPVSGGSDNEDVRTEDEEEEEEVEEENEDNEQEQEEDGVEEQEEEDKKLTSCGSDNEDAHTFEEAGAGVTACIMNTNEGLASPEHALVENLADNLNDGKEADEPTGDEPISIPTENGGDKSIEEIASTAIEAKIVVEQGSEPKKETTRRLIRKRILRGNEGSSISCKAGTSNEANLLCLEDNEVVGVPSIEAKNEKIRNEKKVVGKPIVKIIKKLNSIRKENHHGQSGVKTGSVEQKPKLTNNKPASKENKTIEQEFRKEEVEKSEEARFTRKQKNKKIVEEGTQIVHAKDIDEPGSSEKGKLSKRVESQGMIFMCSSDTKKDCCRYKVFGLSAAKKDLVSKIYKGMRLFLFDVNLKMLYGIYKAAGRGSYDIEPRAFHSQFPSQVRFTVQKDCLPIPEEKFKKVIKDNYFTKTKFNCQLNKYQVRNLCKLFNETAKKSAFKQGGSSQKPRPIDTSSTRVERKRKRVEDSRRVERRLISSQDPGRRRRLPEQTRHSGRTHILRDWEEMRRPIIVRAREEARLAPVVIDERYRHPAVIYDRDAYLPPVESSALYEPYQAEDSPRSRIYSYERSPRIDNYRRESAIDYRDHEISRSRESRHYVPQNVHDPYTIYRESGVYHEPVYDSYPSPERRSSKYYRLSDEYRSPLTDRRRY